MRPVFYRFATRYPRMARSSGSRLRKVLEPDSLVGTPTPFFGSPWRKLNRKNSNPSTNATANGSPRSIAATRSLEKKAAKWNDMYTIPIASGCIAGESIMGVLLAGLEALRSMH